MKPVLFTIAGNPENQDRGVVLQVGPRIVLCVADGAGGRSGGAEAANMAVALVQQNAHRLNNAETCVELLRKMDTAIASDPVAGETTCALAVVAQEQVYGASVGDSGVWLILTAEKQVDLTRAQQRRPFIGSGSAWPILFRCATQPGCLLLATDGLIKYTSAERIATTCTEHPPEAAGERLVELVRYPSGALPDDITAILCRLDA